MLVFISYGKEDQKIALKLFHDLQKANINTWIDIKSLIPGQNWEYSIKKSIRQASFFIALFSSNSVSKSGFFQKELKIALDYLDELPDNKIFIIPVRIDDCELTDKFQYLHWVDLFPSYDKGVKKILRSINTHAENVREKGLFQVQIEKKLNSKISKYTYIKNDIQTSKREFYFPPENINYALSLFTNEEFEYNSTIYRLSVLADLLECIVLSDKIYYEENKEDDDLLDLHLRSQLSQLKLNNIITVKEFKSVPFSDHSFSFSDFYEFIPEIGRLFESIAETKTFSISNATKINEKIQSYLDANLQKHRMIELMNKSENITDYVFATFSAYSEEYSYIFKEDNFTVENKFELTKRIIALFYGMVESAIKTSIINSIPYYPTSLESEAIFTMPYFAPSSKIFLDKINDKKYAEALKLNDFVYSKYNKLIRLPILFNYILSKADNINQLLEIAFDLREAKSTKDFKYRCYQINEALENGNQEDALKMINEIDIYINNINDHIEPSQFIDFIFSFLPKSLLLSGSNCKQNYLMFLKRIYFESLSPVMLQNTIHQFFNVHL